MILSTHNQTYHALLVEDDPVFQTALTQIFHRLGSNWTLTKFDMAASALQWLEMSTTAPHLILVDIGLPDISGIAVIRSARKHFPEVPVMVVSVIAEETTLYSAIRAGASGYLLKGESIDSLLSSVQGVLEGNYPISPSLARHLFKMAGSPHDQRDAHGINLTPREIELLKLLSQGMSYNECSEAMGVALSTVQAHVRTMYRKLEVHTQMQAVSKARQFGVLN